MQPKYVTLEYCFTLRSLYWMFRGFKFLIYYLQTSHKAYENFFLVPFQFW